MAAQGSSTPATSPPSGCNSQSSSTHAISQPPVSAPSPSLLSRPSRLQERSAANNAVKEEVKVKADIDVKLESTVCPKAEELDAVNATEAGSSIHGAESEESVKKYQRYEADYANHLMAKYFSNKDIYGGDIYEVNFSIDDKSIRASRWPCMRSYADPLQSYTQPKGSTSSPDAGIPGNTPNGLTPALILFKQIAKKKANRKVTFEVNFSIDDTSIRAIRWPCMRSYADPLQSYTHPKESTSSPDAGIPGITPNGSVMEE